MEPYLIPLKEKYRARKETNSGSYKQRTGNCHGPTPKRRKGAQGTGHRRNSYFVHLH